MIIKCNRVEINDGVKYKTIKIFGRKDLITTIEIHNARLKGEWITIKPFYELVDGHYQETQSKLDFVKCPFCETVYHGRHNFCGRCGACLSEEV